MEPGFDGRSFVTWKDSKVVLYSDVREKSIAHEFGHVLGLTDHYYSVWRPSRCEYTLQVLDTDIMSNPTTGEVTDVDWASVNEMYPVK